jgi:hypothetical protein
MFANAGGEEMLLLPPASAPAEAVVKGHVAGYWYKKIGHCRGVHLLDQASTTKHAIAIYSANVC